ncbi:MAG: aldo/keto reductase [Pseudomonadota bacterium]
MITRRECLKGAAMLAAAAAVPGLTMAERPARIMRPIPKTGEQVPIIGLGSSATFRRVAQSDDVSALRGVMSTLVDNGGTIFDTAPSYGASEEVSGQIAAEEGITEDIFWATKLNVVPRGESKADEAAARAQVDRSLARLSKKPIDLIQVHNLADLPTQMPILEEYKQDGKIRYIGTTSTRTSRYPDLERAMRDYDIDFIGVDYAIDNRVSAESVLPLAQELGIATLIYVPFGRSRLFSKTKDMALPDWAAEFGAESWAQFFLKYVCAHPATTCVTPATSKPTNMNDNIRALYGDLPTAEHLKKMAALIDGLG